MLRTRLASVHFSGTVYSSAYSTTSFAYSRSVSTQGVFVTYNNENFLILHCENDYSILPARSYSLTLVDLQKQVEAVSLTLTPGEVFFSYAEEILAIKITSTMIADLEQWGVSFDPWVLSDPTEVPQVQTVYSVNFEAKLLKQTIVKKESDVEYPLRGESLLQQVSLGRYFWDEDTGSFESHGSPLVYTYPDNRKVLAGIFAEFDPKMRRANFIPTRTIMNFLKKIADKEFQTLDIYRLSTDLSYDGPILHETNMWVPPFSAREIMDSSELTSLGINGGLRVTAVFECGSLQQNDVITSINGHQIHNRAILLDDGKKCLWNSYFSLEQRQFDEVVVLRDGEEERLTLDIKRAPFVHANSKESMIYPGMLTFFIQRKPLMFTADSAFPNRSFRDTTGQSAIKVTYLPATGGLSPSEAECFRRMTQDRVVSRADYRGHPHMAYSSLWLIKVNEVAVTEISKLSEIFNATLTPVTLTLSRDRFGKKFFCITIPCPAETEEKSTVHYSCKVDVPSKVSTIEKTTASTDGAEDKKVNSETPVFNVPGTRDFRMQLVKIGVAIYNAEKPQAPSTELREHTGLLIKSSQGVIAILTPCPEYSPSLNSIDLVTAQQEHFVVVVKRHMFLANGLVILEVKHPNLANEKIENPVFDQILPKLGSSVNIASFSLGSSEKLCLDLSQTNALVENPAELRTIKQSQLVRLILGSTSIDMSGGLVFLPESKTPIGMVDAYDPKQGVATAFIASTLQRIINGFYQNGFQRDLRPPDIGIVTQPVTDLTKRTLYQGSAGAAIVSRHLDLDSIEIGDLLMRIVIGGTCYEIGSDEQVHTVTPSLPWKHFIHMAYMGDPVRLELKGKDGHEKQVTVILNYTQEDLSRYTRLLSGIAPYVLVDGLLFMLTPPPSVAWYLSKQTIEKQIEPIRWESVYPQDKTHPCKLVSLTWPHRDLKSWSYRDWHLVSVNKTTVQNLQHFHQLLSTGAENLQIQLCESQTENSEIATVVLQNPQIKTNLVTGSASVVEYKAESKSIAHPQSQPQHQQPPCDPSLEKPVVSRFTKNVVKLRFISEGVGDNPLHEQISTGTGSGFFITHGGELCLISAMHVFYGLKKTHFLMSLEILSGDPSHSFVLTGSTLASLPSASCGLPYDVSCFVLRGDNLIIRQIKEFAQPLALATLSSVKKNEPVLIVGFNGTSNYAPCNSNINKVEGCITSIEFTDKQQGLAIDARVNPGMSGGAVLKEEDGELKVVAVVTHVNGVVRDNMAFSALLPNILPAIIDSALAGKPIYDPPIFPFTQTTLQKAGSASELPKTVTLIHKILQPSACQQLKKDELWRALIIGEQRFEITKEGIYIPEWRINVSPKSWIVQRCRPKDTVTVVVDAPEGEKKVECQLIESIPFLKRWPFSFYSVMSQKQQLRFLFLSGFILAETTFEQDESISLSDEPTGKEVAIKEVLPLMRGALARNYLWVKGAVVCKICDEPIKKLSDVKDIYQRNAQRETIQFLLELPNKQPVTVEINNVQSPDHKGLAKEQAQLFSKLLFFKRGGVDRLDLILDPVTRTLVAQGTTLPDVASLELESAVGLSRRVTA